MKKVLLVSILVLMLTIHSLVNVSRVLAVELDVEAPQETMTEGQVFDFKINIDTQGESVSSQEFNVNYDPQYVEFQDGGFLAGDFFDTASYTKVSDGQLYVKAESTAAKSGTGLVAIVKLKIIATAPGTTQICTVEAITPTPTTAPLTPTTIVPTSLPRTGSTEALLSYTLFGGAFLLSAFLIKRML